LAEARFAASRRACPARSTRPSISKREGAVGVRVSFLTISMARSNAIAASTNLRSPNRTSPNVAEACHSTSGRSASVIRRS
jgi:hypothetical protein